MVVLALVIVSATGKFFIVEAASSRCRQCAWKAHLVTNFFDPENGRNDDQGRCFLPNHLPKYAIKLMENYNGI
jgi:hypothetical protein